MSKEMTPRQLASGHEWRERAAMNSYEKIKKAITNSHENYECALNSEELYREWRRKWLQKEEFKSKEKI